MHNLGPTRPEPTGTYEYKDPPTDNDMQKLSVMLEKGKRENRCCNTQQYFRLLQILERAKENPNSMMTPEEYRGLRDMLEYARSSYYADLTQDEFERLAGFVERCYRRQLYDARSPLRRDDRPEAPERERTREEVVVLGEKM